MAFPIHTRAGKPLHPAAQSIQVAHLLIITAGFTANDPAVHAAATQSKISLNQDLRFL